MSIENDIAKQAIMDLLFTYPSISVKTDYKNNTYFQIIDSNKVTLQKKYPERMTKLYAGINIKKDDDESYIKFDAKKEIEFIISRETFLFNLQRVKYIVDRHQIDLNDEILYENKTISIPELVMLPHGSDDFQECLVKRYGQHGICQSPLDPLRYRNDNINVTDWQAIMKAEFANVIKSVNFDNTLTISEIEANALSALTNNSIDELALTHHQFVKKINKQGELLQEDFDALLSINNHRKYVITEIFEENKRRNIDQPLSFPLYDLHNNYFNVHSQYTPETKKSAYRFIITSIVSELDGDQYPNLTIDDLKAASCSVITDLLINNKITPNQVVDYFKKYSESSKNGWAYYKVTQVFTELCLEKEFDLANALMKASTSFLAEFVDRTAFNQENIQLKFNSDTVSPLFYLMSNDQIMSSITAHEVSINTLVKHQSNLKMDKAFISLKNPQGQPLLSMVAEHSHEDFDILPHMITSFGSATVLSQLSAPEINPKTESAIASLLFDDEVQTSLKHCTNSLANVITPLCNKIRSAYNCSDLQGELMTLAIFNSSTDFLPKSWKKILQTAIDQGLNLTEPLQSQPDTTLLNVLQDRVEYFNNKPGSNPPESFKSFVLKEVQKLGPKKRQKRNISHVVDEGL